MVSGAPGVGPGHLRRSLFRPGGTAERREQSVPIHREGLLLLVGDLRPAVVLRLFEALLLARLRAFPRAFGILDLGADAGELEVVELAAGAVDDVERAVAGGPAESRVAFRANPFRLTEQEIADLRRKKAEFIAYGLTVYSPGWATRALAEAAAKQGQGAPMPPRASWSATASGSRRRGNKDR